LLFVHHLAYLGKSNSRLTIIDDLPKAFPGRNEARNLPFQTLEFKPARAAQSISKPWKNRGHTNQARTDAHNHQLSLQ